jgi:hypothetical protein
MSGARLAQGSNKLLMAAAATAEREEIKGFTSDYSCLIERVHIPLYL